MAKGKSDQQLIIQALNAAETNIRLAKKLLSGPPEADSVAFARSTKDIPGITGTFDGENMLAEDGKKYPVNPNYASKSVLVYGDTLKRVEVDGQKRFKQIARVKRHKVEGILAKKTGKWVAVTADGSYKVSPVAVEFHKGEEGDEVVVVLPLDEKNVPYAALESVKKDLPAGKAGEVVSKPPTKKKPATRKKAPTKKPTKKRAVAADSKSATEKTPTPEPVPEAEVENDEELR